MTRLLSTAVAAGILTFAAAPSDAEAYTGVYVSNGSVQVSYPQPYYGGAVYGAAYGGYGSYAVLPPVYQARTYYRGGHGHAGHGHAHWHNTSHYDYHPGEIRRHGNHYHYTPGHYDLHEDGHWDAH
jgi:hypothetical protein